MIEINTADIMRLIILTGLRPGEVAEMRLSQIRTELNGTWLELKKADSVVQLPVQDHQPTPFPQSNPPTEYTEHPTPLQ